MIHTNRRVAYVVTADGLSAYPAMTRVSVASLRISNPAVSVILALDTESAATLAGLKEPLLDEVDEVAAFPVPAGGSAYSNRFIKTNLRNLIDGAYLFLDSDTLVRGDLGEMWSRSEDIAGVLNASRNRMSKGDVRTVAEMGWSVRRDQYLNGGVLFFRDTSAARLVASRWHDKWREGVARSGRYHDQPALNSAHVEAGASVAILSSSFNAQLRVSPKAADRALVWHYMASLGRGNAHPATVFQRIVQQVLAGEPISYPAIAEAMKQPHPWHRRDFMDDWRARRAISRDCFTSGDTLWFEGRRWASIRATVSARAARLKAANAARD